MVANKNIDYPDQELYDYVMKGLADKNITPKTIGEAVYEMEHEYFPEKTAEDFGEDFYSLFKKREVLNLVGTGLMIDDLANRELLPEPMQTIIANDLGQFGVDELISIGIANLYGSLGVTNYGYGDKIKIGYAKELDNEHGEINTFSDDIFTALASGMVGRLGHGRPLDINNKKQEDYKEDAR
ncbi:phosphatidylglycerophosphatase A [Liquorilactobacillus hordei]|uniref:YutG/PgpA domain-containing protein n=1 Tax=Liquorilactobacillus hordei DSM 19519 TaxID=1423759 RepID=A0A0R1MUI1_9LACO|nr:phosphatidylglycerophosphatase A [Liquorilactobacillus hordei]KRL07979.1 hypothetical protein FC92_GL001048 [Liquorilactobacillus hordei DSM 19519]QYH51077.1 phosphatidylglycerophosphatase A [Liquorilactobacillus hordei DSM 19519]